MFLNLFSGDIKYLPKNLMLKSLSFSDKLGWLWAIDKSNGIYFYHVDQYWKKVEGRMRSVSVGVNGVWAVDLNNTVHFRTGINKTHLAGSNWTSPTIAGKLH